MNYNECSKEELIKEIERLQFYVRFHSIVFHNISDGIHEQNNGGETENKFQSFIFKAIHSFIDDCERQAQGKDIKSLREVIECLNNF